MCWETKKIVWLALLQCSGTELMVSLWDMPVLAASFSSQRVDFALGAIASSLVQMTLLFLWVSGSLLIAALGTKVSKSSFQRTHMVVEWLISFGSKVEHGEVEEDAPRAVSFFSFVLFPHCDNEW